MNKFRTLLVALLAAALATVMVPAGSASASTGAPKTPGSIHCVGSLIPFYKTGCEKRRDLYTKIYNQKPTSGTDLVTLRKKAVEVFGSALFAAPGDAENMETVLASAANADDARCADRIMTRWAYDLQANSHWISLWTSLYTTTIGMGTTSELPVLAKQVIGKVKKKVSKDMASGLNSVIKIASVRSAYSEIMISCDQ